MSLQISRETLEWIESDDVQLTLIKEGDHRLSKPTELNLIIETLNRLTLSS